MASKLHFRWKPDLGKRWLKVIKECDIEEESRLASFDISIEKDVMPEDVWD